MRLFKKIPITFEGKDYEIRVLYEGVLYEDTTISVIAFLNNYPANGYRHQVQLPKNCNVERVLEQGFVDELVEMSKNDIIEKRWEKLSKVIR
jgi:hypothetical protein